MKFEIKNFWVQFSNSLAQTQIKDTFILGDNVKILGKTLIINKNINGTVQKVKKYQFGIRFFSIKARQNRITSSLEESK